MIRLDMLTVSLTASDPAARKDGAGSRARAASENWGVGHPSAARRYLPPHPLSYPSRKTFFAPKMNSRIPHIDKISMCGAGQGEGRITLNQPQKAWSGFIFSSFSPNTILPLTAPHRHFMSHTKDTRSPTHKTPPTPLHGSAMMYCE